GGAVARPRRAFAVGGRGRPRPVPQARARAVYPTRRSLSGGPPAAGTPSRPKVRALGGCSRSLAGRQQAGASRQPVPLPSSDNRSRTAGRVAHEDRPVTRTPALLG